MDLVALAFPRCVFQRRQADAPLVCVGSAADKRVEDFPVERMQFPRRAGRQFKAGDEFHCRFLCFARGPDHRSLFGPATDNAQRRDYGWASGR